jgi:hypothetical protein
MPKRRDRELEAAYPSVVLTTEPTCPLCDRPIEAGDGNEHHLVPVHKGGQSGPTVFVHVFCHSKVHSVFTNAELAKTYNTPEAIRSHPAMAEFIHWLQSKPAGFRTKNRMANDRKAKQRR